MAKHQDPIHELDILETGPFQEGMGLIPAQADSAEPDDLLVLMLMLFFLLGRASPEKAGLPGKSPK
jgi:hypothetical protein